MARPFYTDEQIAHAFWAKVNQEGPVSPFSPDGLPCWLWTGAKQKSKTAHYGHLNIRGRSTLVHRYSWEQSNGRPPRPGLDIDHECQVKLCVRPSHLREASRTDNNLNQSGPYVNNRSTGVRCVYVNTSRGKPFLGVATYRGRGIRKTFDTVREASEWVDETRGKMRNGEL